MARKTAITKNLPLVVIADAYKNITNLLSNEKHPMIDILKINVFEGSFIAEIPPLDDSDTLKRNEHVISIGNIFSERFSQYLQYLIMTDGGKPAWCFDLKNKRYWYFVLPKIKVVNPIGCGDTCTSVLSSILSQMRNTDGKEVREKLKFNDDTPDVVIGLKWGLAAASAKTLTLTGGDFDEKVILQLFDQIKMSEEMKMH
ncbi:hypothetical protein RFI_17745 [Reticulomyxa filosa]|uniref:Carbohydrate kinase PfkB domain-containing protein n=1 Tax=Reticulomyxa filosa TaxID=46433 RepID=X6N0A8_RETFI|nr:hypothetical protein RFI_17745 [Reticulomyxa filosa]|eukprot:ETO19486.1 hypothetical protein RFI_17745 [Reticulomyxa filosa]